MKSAPPNVHSDEADSAMKTDSEWEARHAAERRLYEKYGKRFEADRSGEFIAIGMDGETLLGKRDGETLARALDKFGSGDFIMARVGSEWIHEIATAWPPDAP